MPVQVPPLSADDHLLSHQQLAQGLPAYYKQQIRCVLKDGMSQQLLPGSQGVKPLQNGIYGNGFCKSSSGGMSRRVKGR